MEACAIIKRKVMLVLTGPPTDVRHRRLGGCCRLAVPSGPELSPCPLLRVEDLLPLVKGLGSSSLGLGESLLRARKAEGEEVPSPCNTYQGTVKEKRSKNLAQYI